MIIIITTTIIPINISHICKKRKRKNKCTTTKLQHQTWTQKSTTKGRNKTKTASCNNCCKKWKKINKDVKNTVISTTKCVQVQQGVHKQAERKDTRKRKELL